METRKSPLPYLTTEEYNELIAEAALHLSKLGGFKVNNLADDWRQAELRILNLITDIGAQYDGNTKLER